MRVGHLIIYSQIGLPDLGRLEGEFFGFHECGGGPRRAVAASAFRLRWSTTCWRATQGQPIHLQRAEPVRGAVAEQDRSASPATRKLSEFAAGWTDEHDLSQPLTGAFFDILVDVYHESCPGSGLISPEVEDLLDRIERNAGGGRRMSSSRVRSSLRGSEQAFRAGAAGGAGLPAGLPWRRPGSGCRRSSEL